MMRKAFTLIELLVAILVLLAVLLASGSIFNATSKVTGVGEAVSDVTADLQAFERAFRDDLSSITRDGYLLIRCVAVRNDIRIQDGRYGLQRGFPVVGLDMGPNGVLDKVCIDNMGNDVLALSYFRFDSC